LEFPSSDGRPGLARVFAVDCGGAAPDLMMAE
jgi:hypothetical protein